MSKLSNTPGPKADDLSPKPADTLTLKVDGEDRDFFMSFGLLDLLGRIIESPARIGPVYTDPDLREEVLKAAFAKRKKSGKIDQEPFEAFDDIDVAVDDVEKMLDWVVGHVTHFFVRSLKKVVAVTEQNQGALQALMSFLGGSTASPSPTPSAGPSA